MSKENLVMRIIMQANDKASAAFKNIHLSSNALSGSLLKTKKEMRELDKVQGVIAKYGDNAKKLMELDKALKNNAESIRKLNAEIKNTESPTKAQKAALEKLKKESADLTERQARLKIKNQELSATMDKAGYSASKMSEAKRILQQRSDSLRQSYDKEKATLERLNGAEKKYQRAKDMQSKLTSTGIKAGAMGVATGAAVMLPIKEYASAETANTDLRVAMMDKSGKVAEEYAKVEKLATRLGDKLPGTTADFTNLMTMLVRQGMSAKTILGGTGEAAALLAVQLKLAPEAAAEMAAKLQDATRGTEAKMIGIMDTVQRLFYAGVDGNNIVPAFSRLAPALDIIKMNGKQAMDTMGPLIGMLDQAALTGEAAGNALRKVFSRAMDNDKIEKALSDYKKDGTLDKSFNLKFTDNKGEFAGLENMYTQLLQLKNLSTEMRLDILNSIWGDDAETQQALNTMISQGQSGYNEFAKKMADQASLQQRVDMQLGTLSNLWESASGTATNFLVKMGESIAPEVKMLTTYIGGIAEKMSQWAAANPQLAATLMKIAAITAVVLGVVSMLSLGIAAVLGPIALMQLSWAKLGISMIGGASKIGAILNLLKTGIMAVGRVFLMNPIGLAITAIVVGLYFLWKHWDTVKKYLTKGWDIVSKAAGEAWDGIVAKVSAAWDGIKNAASSVFSWFDGLFANNPILNFIFPIIGIPRMIIANWQPISAWFTTLWSGITMVASAIWQQFVSHIDGIKNTLTMIWNAMVSGALMIWQMFTGSMSAIWQHIKNVAVTAWSALVSYIANYSPLAPIIQNWDKIIAFLLGLKDRMVGIGRNIIDGLINGIKSGFEGLKSLWASINSFMPDFARKKMDIRSPSRVMGKIGSYIMQGLSVGIEKGKTGLANTYAQAIGLFQNPITTGGFLDRAVKTFMPEGNPMHPQLAGAIAAPVGGFGQSNKTTNQNMSAAGDNITIQIFTGNNDVGDVRKQIEQFFRERDMKKQRSRKSSMWDQD